MVGMGETKKGVEEKAETREPARKREKEREGGEIWGERERAHTTIGRRSHDRAFGFSGVASSGRKTRGESPSALLDR